MLTIALVESENGVQIPGTHWRLVIGAGKAREIAALLAFAHGATIEYGPIDYAKIQERRAAQGLEAGR
jgi:hypothetical protein